MSLTQNAQATMASARIFGTDGIRGRAFEGWLSEASVSALGRAVGRAHKPHMEAGDKPVALLGHDGRASGPVLEAALARVSLAGAQLKLSAAASAIATAEPAKAAFDANEVELGSLRR